MSPSYTPSEPVIHIGRVGSPFVQLLTAQEYLTRVSIMVHDVSMQELQSTDVLDNEILEDARKKAFRALKGAEDKIKDNALTWKRKTAAALKELAEKYEARLVRERDEVLARLVQDKRRIRAIKIESLLKGAVNDYLSSLDRPKLLALLEAELGARLDALEAAGAGITAADKPVVMIRALAEAEAETLLANSFFREAPGNGREGAQLPFWAFTALDSNFRKAGLFPALTVNTKSVKVTASTDSAAEALLEDKRAELVTALMGAEALL